MPSLSGFGGGAASGAMTGASLGSIVPGVGNLVGAGIGGIVGGLKGLFGGGKKKKSATGPQDPTDYGGIMGGWQNIANTGGLSQQNMQDIRSRGTSPIRSIYSGARRDINRGRSLQGGYSPNYSASLAKMAREQSQSTADANINAEAGIAEMQQKGKLAGLSGQSQLWGTHQNAPTDYQRGLSSVAGTMDVLGRGAQAGGSIVDAFKFPKKPGTAGGYKGYTGPSNIASQNVSSTYSNLPSRRIA